jgi:hypothetical protein
MDTSPFEKEERERERVRIPFLGIFPGKKIANDR